jgi:hypothetical protein
MGTSSRFGGPGPGLVPSWADDPAPAAAPAQVQPPLAPPAPQPPPTTAPPGAVPPPQIPAHQVMPSLPGSLRSARRSFNKFAKGGDPRNLGKSLSSYVRKGTGGSHAAARRMGASRAAGARLLSFVRSVEQSGPAAALRQFNLEALASQPAAEVFAALIDFICPSGGAIEEAIARQAMLDAISDFADAGLTDFDAMSNAERREFFLDFIIRSIEGRIITDIATRGVASTASVAAMEDMQQQLHDFVDGHTRGTLGSMIDGPANATDADMLNTIDAIYEAGFELLGLLGDDE